MGNAGNFPKPPPPSAASFGEQGPTEAVWYTTDFVLGAGCVVLQPATKKIILVHNPKWNLWFLPRGRKDASESLEQAALREAYEETGYRAESLPLFIPCRAPRPNSTTARAPLTEPIYISLAPFVDPLDREHGGTYLTHWFVAQIPEDAQLESGTHMPGEEGFETHLLDFDAALEKLEQQLAKEERPIHEDRVELAIVRRAIELWRRTQAILAGEVTLDEKVDIGSCAIDRKWY